MSEMLASDTTDPLYLEDREHKKLTRDVTRGFVGLLKQPVVQPQPPSKTASNSSQYFHEESAVRLFWKSTETW